LKEITFRQGLKQRVLDSIGNIKLTSRCHGIKLSLSASFVAVVFVISLVQIPSVYAQAMPAFSNVIAWIKEVTQLTVKTPGAWPPIKEYDSGQEAVATETKTQENAVNYSFFTDSGSDRYYISIYTVDAPVPVSRSVFFGQKDIPFGYREYGYISGQRITGDMIPVRYHYDIPEDAEQFVLIPEVKGYRTDQGAGVWWKQGNWLMEFNGSSNSMDKLKELASEWKDIPLPAAENGHVEIVEGNMYNTWITWDKDEIRYSCYIRGTFEGKAIKDIMNSFEYGSTQSTPVNRNIASRLQKTAGIPAAIPHIWEPFAEYDRNAGDYIQKEEGSISGNDYNGSKYYYFEAERSPEGYRAEAYHAEYPVAFNDKEADLQKNGPKFPERFAGSFSAEKLQEGMTFPEWTLPKSSPRLTLIQGVTAFNEGNGSSISWKQGKWTFKYQDSNSVHTDLEETIKYLKEFASLWKSNTFIISGNGHVNISRDSKLHAYLSWEDGGVIYGYSSPTADIKDIIKVLKSFKANDISIP